MDVQVLDLVKVGGPVFALALVVVVFADRHVRNMITILTNHLTHVEKELAKAANSSESTRFAIERLVDRLDRYFIDRSPNDPN